MASTIKDAGADLSDLHDEMKKVKGKLEMGEGASNELQEELKVLYEREKILCDREEMLIKHRDFLIIHKRAEANRVGMFPPLHSSLFIPNANMITVY